MYFNSKGKGKMKKSKGKGKLAKSGVSLATKYASPVSEHTAAKRKGKRNLKKAC